jgi:hypothetical protein
MKHPLDILVLIFLVSVSVTGFAAVSGDLINGEFDSTSKKERIEIARDILGRVENLSNYVSAVSPSEREWVLTEQEALHSLRGTDAYHNRLNQLYDSAEFQNLKLKSLLDSIERNLMCVIGEDPNIEDTSISQEMLCWSLADRDLSSRITIDAAIPILIKHNRLPEDIGEKSELKLTDYFDYSHKFEWMAHGINEYIVIPYLRGGITE